MQTDLSERQDVASCYMKSLSKAGYMINYSVGYNKFALSELLILRKFTEWHSLLSSNRLNRQLSRDMWDRKEVHEIRSKCQECCCRTIRIDAHPKGKHGALVAFIYIFVNTEEGV